MRADNRRRMAVEGGLAGWRQELELLRDRVSLVGVMNRAWYRDPDPGIGDDRWHVNVAPLTGGVAPWPEVVANPHRPGYDGDYAVHSSFGGTENRRVPGHARLLEQTGRDRACLRGP